MKTICISGGFDPIHIGHADLISEASQYGRVTIILNSDEWLIRKKNYFLMPWAHRAKILLMMQDVAEVVRVDDSDGTVCNALEILRPDYFANGGDRTIENTPELLLCNELGIDAIFNVGGVKQESSSDIIKRVAHA